MAAHPDVLRRIAVAADRPLSGVVQAARVLGDHGLYDRPGRGYRYTRIRLSSIANVAIAIIAGGPMAAAENVSLIRPLKPQRTVEDRTLEQPVNYLAGWDPSRDWSEYPAGDWPILPGENLGDSLEKLVDRVAKNADPRLISLYRHGLEVVILAADEPLAQVRLWFPAAKPWMPQAFLSTNYLPPEGARNVPRKHGAGFDGRILFSLVEELARVWQENYEANTDLTRNRSPARPSKADPAAALAGASGRRLRATPRVLQARRR